MFPSIENMRESLFSIGEVCYALGKIIQYESSLLAMKEIIEGRNVEYAIAPSKSDIIQQDSRRVYSSVSPSLDTYVNFGGGE